MADTSTQSLVARIENALSRIEAASAARAFSGEQLARRHAALRAKIEDAVLALDALIAREAAAGDGD